jgi:hypothetical protein
VPSVSGKSGGEPGESELVALAGNVLFDTLGRRVYVEKATLSAEDTVAFAFAGALEALGIRYSVVAGYVSILFGRSRRSDDIDFIAEPIGEDRFTALCAELRNRGFSLMQGDINLEESLKRVYRGYLSRGLSVRFMYMNLVIPNVEFKLARNPLHAFSIENSIEVFLNGKRAFRVAPLELQIAYKLYLGSDKDVGDAVFLYELFKPVLKMEELNRWCAVLGVDASALEGA